MFIKNRICFIFTCIICTWFLVDSNAQDFNKPSDPALRVQVEDQYKILRKSVLDKKAEQGLNAFHWIIKNYPQYSKYVYIHGAKSFVAAIKNETNPDRQNILKDSLLMLYDIRIKHFNNAPQIMQRKVVKYYKYFKKDESRLKDLFNQFQKTLVMNNYNVTTAVSISYFNTVSRYQNSIGGLNPLEIQNQYRKIIEQLEKRKAPKKEIEKVKNFAFKIVHGPDFKLDCNYISSVLIPRINQGNEEQKTQYNKNKRRSKKSLRKEDNRKEDDRKKLIKKILEISAQLNCFQNEFYDQLINEIGADTKDPAYLYYFAIARSKENKNAASEKLFDRAFSYSKDPKERSKILIGKGDLFF